MSDQYLSPTALLNFQDASIQALITAQGWRVLSPRDRIGAAYDFVRNDILFGYNADDALPASQVLSDGYGQCNTKGVLLMALLRALDIPCRFHAFTVNKRLQRGVVPELVYPLAPRNIIHSWVEVLFEGDWLNLEGFILDAPVLENLQKAFPDRQSLCAYGAGTDCLQKPDVDWRGTDTYIQKTSINADFGIYDDPDSFFAEHRQLGGLKGLLYRYIVRHWMNHRVARMRDGHIPRIPGGAVNLEPAQAEIEIGRAV